MFRQGPKIADDTCKCHHIVTIWIVGSHVTVQLSATHSLG